jgi:pyruvate formate lyase activating enzyme
MVEGPIEQKPLFHFHPGMKVLSIGGLGCNLSCGFCQNHEISQVGRKDSLLNKLPLGKQSNIPDIPDMVSRAKSRGNGGVAFTYSEPMVWYEYVMDVAKQARKAGLKTILKTNAYANEDAFSEMLDVMDAVNIDIKGPKQAYKDVCGIEVPDDLGVIMRNLGNAVRKCHVEVSMPAIPPYCHQPETMSIMFEMQRVAGRSLPIHVLRVAPDHKMKDLKTDDWEVSDLFYTARGYFQYVYSDLKGGSLTTCYECGNLLVERQGLKVTKNNLVRGKFCPNCYCWTVQNFEGL